MSLPCDPGLESRARHYGERLLGLFFRAWAHELNNPVQAVLAGAELIDMELELTDATLASLRTQVRSQAREVATEVMRISDGIARLHALSRPLERLSGESRGDEVLAEVIALWRPVARHLGVRTEGPDAGGVTPRLGLGGQVASVMVLGALAAIGRADPVPERIELSWSLAGQRSSLRLLHGDTEPRFLDRAAWEALVELAGVTLNSSPEALELIFAAP